MAASRRRSSLRHRRQNDERTRGIDVAGKSRRRGRRPVEGLFDCGHCLRRVQGRPAFRGDELQAGELGGSLLARWGDPSVSVKPGGTQHPGDRAPETLQQPSAERRVRPSGLRQRSRAIGVRNTALRTAEPRGHRVPRSVSDRVPGKKTTGPVAADASIPKASGRARSP